MKPVKGNRSHPLKADWNMIHVVFNESEVDLMRTVMELDETLKGEVMLIRDDFAVGPLSGLDSEAGWQARLDWWKDISVGSPYVNAPALFDDRETVKDLKARLDANPEEEMWIWMGQNQHDVTGYYWLMPQFRNYQGRVMVRCLALQADRDRAAWLTGFLGGDDATEALRDAVDLKHGAHATSTWPIPGTYEHERGASRRHSPPVAN